MSVLINGMDELPEDGAVLVVRHDDNGKVYIKFADVYGYSMQLVKLPDKHGDLIDRDALEQEMMNGIKAGNLEEGYEMYADINTVYDCVECVRWADAVIEAEDET